MVKFFFVVYPCNKSLKTNMHVQYAHTKLLFGSIPLHVFHVKSLCGLKSAHFLPQPESRVRFPKFVWRMMVSSESIALPQFCLQVVEESAWSDTETRLAFEVICWPSQSPSLPALFLLSIQKTLSLFFVLQLRSNWSWPYKKYFYKLKPYIFAPVGQRRANIMFSYIAGSVLSPENSLNSDILLLECLHFWKLMAAFLHEGSQLYWD